MHGGGILAYIILIGCVMFAVVLFVLVAQEAVGHACNVNLKIFSDSAFGFIIFNIRLDFR